MALKRSFAGNGVMYLVGSHDFQSIIANGLITMAWCPFSVCSQTFIRSSTESTMLLRNFFSCVPPGNTKTNPIGSKLWTSTSTVTHVPEPPPPLALSNRPREWANLAAEDLVGTVLAVVLLEEDHIAECENLRSDTTKRDRKPLAQRPDWRPVPSKRAVSASLSTTGPQIPHQLRQASRNDGPMIQRAAIRDEDADLLAVAIDEGVDEDLLQHAARIFLSVEACKHAAHNRHHSSPVQSVGSCSVHKRSSGRDMALARRQGNSQTVAPTSSHVNVARQDYSGWAIMGTRPPSTDPLASLCQN